MTQVVDVYFLFRQFDEALIRAFISGYLPGFVETTGYYEFPPYRGETVVETDDFDEFLLFLLAEEKAYFHFYFSPPNEQCRSEISGGMLFFNKDGTLYLGVIVPDDCYDKYVEEVTGKLGPAIALGYYEVLPPDNALDFEKAYYQT